MKKSYKKIQPIEYRNGITVLNMGCTADSDDWMAAGRLRQAAKDGDPEAIEALKKLEGTGMIEFSGE